MICPVCGGEVRRIRHMGPGGTRHFSLCCGVPLAIVDNWDVLEILHDDLRNKAVLSARATQAAMQQHEIEMAEEYKEAELTLDKVFPNRQENMKT